MVIRENEEPIIKKGRSFFSNAFNYFTEYCDKTSIHGFKYFGETGRYFIEKIWWFFTFTTCLGVCSFLIRHMYINWQNCPVIVSFATRDPPIYEIPFAGVTICPESKLVQNKFNYTHVMNRINEDVELNDTEREHFQYMSLVCDASLETLANLNTSDTIVKNSTKFFEFIHDVGIVTFTGTQNFVYPDSPIWYWEFMGEKGEYDFLDSSIFNQVLTDEGICYSFNTIDPDELFTDDTEIDRRFKGWTERSTEWSINKGYIPSAGLDTYPRRALLAGAQNSLVIRLLTRKENMDFTCKSSGLQGYKVNFHIPQRVPRLSQQYFLVPLDQKVVATIQPEMIKTSENVKKYTPQQRECFFSSDRSLRFFRNYTKSNCEMECLANYTLRYCGCVKFFMPRESSTPICGTANIQCMLDAEKEMQIEQLKRGLTKHSKETNTSQVFGGCNCLPMCTDLTYNYQLSQSDWDWEKQYHANYGLNLKEINKSLYHFSQLTVYFNGHITTSERNELYGPTSFLANFGGLISLFTGFSILSMVELIYFLSLRVICNLKLYGFGNWSGRLG